MMLATAALFMNLSMPLWPVKLSSKSSKELILAANTVKLSDSDCEKFTAVMAVTVSPAFGKRHVEIAERQHAVNGVDILAVPRLSVH